MAYVLCTLNITVKLRVKFGEALTVKRPLLVRVYEGSALGWFNATIHSRRKGFETAVVKCGIHMAFKIVMRHSQGGTMQYIALSIPKNATITTRLAIASYHDDARENLR